MPMSRPSHTVLKDPSPKNFQGPLYLPLGSIHREGTRGWLLMGGGGISPHLFPCSDRRLERKWGSGKIFPTP